MKQEGVHFALTQLFGGEICNVYLDRLPSGDFQSKVAILKKIYISFFALLNITIRRSFGWFQMEMGSEIMLKPAPHFACWDSYVGFVLLLGSHHVRSEWDGSPGGGRRRRKKKKPRLCAIFCFKSLTFHSVSTGIAESAKRGKRGNQWRGSNLAPSFSDSALICLQHFSFYLADRFLSGGD